MVVKDGAHQICTPIKQVYNLANLNYRLVLFCLTTTHDRCTAVKHTIYPFDISNKRVHKSKANTAQLMSTEPLS